MIRLNSTATFINKRLFPGVWMGFVLMIALVVISTAVAQRAPAMLIALPFVALFAGFGYLIMRWFLLDLVDEVWDDGDALLVKNRRHDVRIPLADIMNVGYSGFQNPPRVTLYLRQPTELGSEIAFIPPLRVFTFRMPAEVRELMERVDEARRSAQPSDAQ